MARFLALENYRVIIGRFKYTGPSRELYNVRFAINGAP